MPSEYPEHEKMERIKDESQVIGLFLDRMSEFGYYVGELIDQDSFRDAEFVQTNDSINTILAKYFDIDLMKIESEKRIMLDDIRMKNHAFEVLAKRKAKRT